jgi:hypothetical protein
LAGVDGLECAEGGAGDDEAAAAASLRCFLEGADICAGRRK